MTFSKDSVNLKHLMHHFENVVNSEGFSLPLVTKLPNLCEILWIQAVTIVVECAVKLNTNEIATEVTGADFRICLCCSNAHM